MIKGHCLCGKITYEYRGEITELAICHCDQCKRAQGTPFATNAPVLLEHFRVITGAEQMKEYNASEDKRRVFCSNCGSPLYSQRLENPGTIRLRVGTISEGLIPRPNYHIYYGSRSDWFEIDDTQIRYVAAKSN